MSSQSSGPLTTLLMFVPLVAVPALAIFGIPEFAPMTALGRASATVADAITPAKNHDLQTTDDLISPVKNTINGGAKAAIEAMPSGGDLRSSDPFQANAATNAAPQQPSDDVESWTPPADVLRDWDPHPVGTESGETAKAARSSPKEPGEFNPGVFDVAEKQKKAVADVHADASPFRPIDDDDLKNPNESDSAKNSDWTHDEVEPSKADTSVDRGKLAEKSQTGANNLAKEKRADAAASEPSATRKRSDLLTWRTAVQKLNKLGIKDFQLQPSDEPNLFHFSCSFTETDRPRISHRFEAEAEEPLHAVQKVLVQVESMSSKRP